jgi:hypothetical protein
MVTIVTKVGCLFRNFKQFQITCAEMVCRSLDVSPQGSKVYVIHFVFVCLIRAELKLVPDEYFLGSTEPSCRKQ